MMRRLVRTVGETALSMAALLGVVCVLAAVASAVFGITPLVFRSGSMSPTIGTGSLALAHRVPAGQLHVGDVVSVPWHGTRVTHRVVAIHRGGPTTELSLKGDANEVADPAPYAVRSADRVFAHVPDLGYAVAWTTSGAGMFTGGVVLAALVGVIVWPRRRTHGSKARPATAVGMAVLMLAVAAGAGAIARSPGTWAYWMDASKVTSGNFTAYTVAKPVISCTRSGGLLSGYTLTMKWPVSTTPYPLTYTATIPGNTQQPTITSSGGTDSVAITSGLLSSMLGSSATLQVTATLPNTNPAWTAVGSQNFTTGLLGLSFDCSGSSY